MTTVNITSPVGRMVMGSLYRANTTDAEGKPLVFKTGAQAGQPRTNYFFALAIPKAGEQHWNQTAWGAQIWNTGAQAFPQIHQSPAFSWKIEDGDSAIPNKRGRKPCDNEGWKGHWILKFSGTYAPKVYKMEGSGYVQVVQEDFVKPGYFIEVAFNVSGNGSQSQPGVYLNHGMICFRAYGQEIVMGPDVNSAGFGQSALPAGASTVPPASSVAMPAPVAAPVSVPPVAPVAPVVPVAVAPNPGILMPPVAPTAPVAPPVPTKRMTAAANGVTYEAYIAAGWNDQQLIQNGLLEV